MSDPKPKLIGKTKRLILEEFTLQDGEFVYQLMNTPSWHKFIGDRNIRSVEDAKKYIRNSFITNYLHYGFGLYKVTLREGRTPVGLCGILQRDYLEFPDIGFAVLPEYEGKGYAYEASLAILDFASSKLGIKKVVAITSKENMRSQKLLERLGLKFEKKITTNENKELLMYA